MALRALPPLAAALHAAPLLAERPAHAEAAADALLLFSSADVSVKGALAARDVLPRLIEALAPSEGSRLPAGAALKVLRVVKQLCMGDRATLDELQRAEAVPRLVALLRAESAAEAQHMRTPCIPCASHARVFQRDASCYRV